MAEILLGGTGLLGGCTTMEGGGARVRSEFVIRNGHILTTKRSTGDIPRGDIQVRDGAIVAVGQAVNAPGIEVLDATGMLVVPGFIGSSRC